MRGMGRGCQGVEEEGERGENWEGGGEFLAHALHATPRREKEGGGGLRGFEGGGPPLS